MSTTQPTEKAEAHTAEDVRQHGSPGPWKAVVIDTDGEYTEWAIQTVPPPIISGIPPVARIGFVNERGMADAMLIAAAPDLLEVCKQAVEFCRYIAEENAEPGLEEIITMRSDALAAIARAEKGAQ